MVEYGTGRGRTYHNHNDVDDEFNNFCIINLEKIFLVCFYLVLAVGHATITTTTWMV